ncbi:MAG: 4,5-dihydroxyphthalate decarboxylase [Actinomycetota bacterium]|nr:4,5-dihydroxyphthalate decarboxylase [Actinomycetota bacterium]
MAVRRCGARAGREVALSGKLPLSLACGDYDRTRALHDGSVTATGIDLTCLRLPVEEIFFRTARFAEFDIAEMSLSSYLLSLDDDGFGKFVAIPVFPSRSFRHNGIYVHAGSGIDEPAQLVGRVVGVPEFQLTAVVWIRGLLAEHYGVPADSVDYRTGGLHAPGRQEKLKLQLPAGVRAEAIPEGKTLSDMLAAGEIDALYTPRVPKSYRLQPDRVRRLFADVQGEEMRYFHKTGLFPLMHTVVIRRDVYEANRWIARSLLEAFEIAKQDALRDLDETAALRYMLPWLVLEVERTHAALGKDYWTYGLAGNEANLATLIRYSNEQGLARRRFDPAELFAPETLQATIV